MPSSEHHQLPWRPCCEYRVRRYGQLCRPAGAMDAIIKLQGPRSSPSLFVSSILHSPLVFPFNIVTFDASGIPEWVRHHWVPDRPTSIRFQALPEHRPNQHSRQVKILICESRHEIDHIITSQVGRHAGEREGEGQHCLVQVDGRHCHPPAAF